MDCGQTLVSYTTVRADQLPRDVVDCGQTLVSYTPQVILFGVHLVVDCGQTLVSYTSQPGFRPIRQLWIADRPW